MRLRGLVVLATVAALLGAPPSASAAANVLHSPSASPTSGTTDTVFQLGAAYDGRFPASSVSATAGGHTVELAMVAGSSTAGAWQGGLRLPPGTWPVTFAADAERGGDPTLAGPILIVAAATPGPVISVPASAPDLSSPTAADDLSSPTAADDSHGSARDTTDVGDEPVAASAVATPAPAPDEAPAPSGSTSGGENSPAAPAPAPFPSSAATATAEATAAGTPTSGEPAVAAEPATGAAPRDTPSPAPPARAATADRSAIASGGSEAAPAEPDWEEAGGDGVLVDDELVTMSARTTGIWGALLLVAIGTGLGFLFRRRRRASSEADALNASTEAEVILQRRAVRRGRLRVPDEDPIVASMRLGERDGSRRPPPRRRAGRPEEGPD